MLYFILRPTDSLLNSTVLTGNDCAPAISGRQSPTAMHAVSDSGCFFIRTSSLETKRFGPFDTAWLDGIRIRCRVQEQNLAAHDPPLSLHYRTRIKHAHQTWCEAANPRARSPSRPP